MSQTIKLKEMVEEAIDEFGKNHTELYYDDENDKYGVARYEDGLGRTGDDYGRIEAGDIEHDVAIALAEELGIAYCI